MAIAVVSYRKEERWTWYVSWFLPVLYLASVANNYEILLTYSAKLSRFSLALDGLRMWR